VPFFKDPSAPTGGVATLYPYRCAYYRVKDMPTCKSSEPGNCPFNEEFVPDPNAPNGKSNDILSEILLNLTNPDPGAYNIALRFPGNGDKGNPRLMRDPDSVTDPPLGNQFFIDATTAVIDWPAFGTGTPNDYSPVQRFTSNPVGGTGCVDIIKPDSDSQNGGSAIKVIIEVRTGPRGTNGLCQGALVPDLVTSEKNITLAIANPGKNVLVIYCDTPGNSLGCFTPVNGQAGRYQSTVDLTNPPFDPDIVNPYIFAVTSVNRPSADPGQQAPGGFPPRCRNIWICPTGQNCSVPAYPPCQ
jgi:hypothetical protein